ncbi:hypothetical protein [Duganella radicis]|uniref:Uncharacterized protein n=1 Tax=Duganella radicis TaxID=551988 RepID=A0A6L6PMA6_9BURK|nr:hypothetical protein [Duganella radicis]MTV40238.1 hypothetical protein [Duganella radicis]
MPIDTAELVELVNEARQGRMKIAGFAMTLPDGGNVYTYSPVPPSEPDFCVAQLEVRTNSTLMLSHQFDYALTNAELRSNVIPFDGVADLLSLFGFGFTGHMPVQPMISIQLHPPADIIFSDCSLEKNHLKLRVLKRDTFKPEQLSIGLRQFPNPTTARRKQIGAEILWEAAELQGFESGSIEMDLDDCATAQLMASVDGFTVRRMVVLDPHKSLNPRLTDYRYLDPNLTQLNKYLFSPKDARQLEVGTAALLHLIGGTSLNPPGSDTPDVIVETPKKKLALVECTTKVENIREKVGKLVGRRDGLIAVENKYGVNREVMAILLVNQPATSIVDEQEFLSQHQVALLTLEDIHAMMGSLEYPPDLDKLYLEKLGAMRGAQLPLFDGHAK